VGARRFGESPSPSQSTGDRPGTLWGTEEQPTVLRKAWWVLKAALLTPWT